MGDLEVGMNAHGGRRARGRWAAKLAGAAVLAAIGVTVGVSQLGPTVGATEYTEGTSGNVTDCRFPDDYLTETGGLYSEWQGNHIEYDINGWSVRMERQVQGAGTFSEIDNGALVSPGDVIRFRVMLTDTTSDALSGVQIYSQTIGSYYRSAPSEIEATFTGPAAPAGATGTSQFTGVFPTIDNEGEVMDTMLLPTSPVFSDGYSIDSAQPSYDFSFTPAIAFPQVYFLSYGAECTWPAPLAFSVVGDGDRDGVADGTDPAPSDACVPSVVAVSCDQDADGMPNDAEAVAGTNPTVADTDGDGVLDGVEVVDGSDPLVLCDPITTFGSCDPDEDGLDNASEADLGTDPAVADSDGDTLLDGNDSDPNEPCDPDPAAGTCDRDGDGLTNARESEIGTSPTVADTDGDGQVDGTDSSPIDACVPDVGVLPCDQDMDGLTNAQEATGGTDPVNADTDADGLLDGEDSSPLDRCLPDDTIAGCAGAATTTTVTTTSAVAPTTAASTTSSTTAATSSTTAATSSTSVTSTTIAAAGSSTTSSRPASVLGATQSAAASAVTGSNVAGFVGIGGLATMLGAALALYALRRKRAGR